MSPTFNDTPSWDEFYIRRVADGREWQHASPRPIFSPDGSAIWDEGRNDEGKHHFLPIDTRQEVALPVPTPFTSEGTTLVAISGDGRVWAGFNQKGEPLWTTLSQMPRAKP